MDNVEKSTATVVENPVNKPVNKPVRIIPAEEMTAYMATALYDEWRRRLDLGGWDIKFEWCVRRDDMKCEDALGCTVYEHSNGQAIIQMLDAVDAPKGSKFVYDYEKTLVHELLHVKFATLDDTGDALRDKLTHRMVDDLARAFVRTKREVISGDYISGL